MKTCPTCHLDKQETEYQYGYKDCKACIRIKRLPRELERRREKTAKNPKHIKTTRIYDETGVLTHKSCGHCRKTLPVADFSLNIKISDGFAALCRSCTKKWRDRRDNVDTRKRLLLSRVKSSAKTKNLPFNLTIEDIEIPTHCPVLGIELEFGHREDDKTWRENSPSLDRIIPSLGYVKGNVVVVSYRANRIKNDATIAELRQVAQFYESLSRNVTTAAAAARQQVLARHRNADAQCSVRQ